MVRIFFFTFGDGWIWKSTELKYWPARFSFIVFILLFLSFRKLHWFFETIFVLICKHFQQNYINKVFSWSFSVSRSIYEEYQRNISTLISEFRSFIIPHLIESLIDSFITNYESTFVDFRARRNRCLEINVCSREKKVTGTKLSRYFKYFNGYNTTSYMLLISGSQKTNW